MQAMLQMKKLDIDGAEASVRWLTHDSANACCGLGRATFGGGC